MADEQNIVTTIGIAAKADVKQATRALGSLTKKLEQLKTAAVAMEGRSADAITSLSHALTEMNLAKNAIAPSLPKKIVELGDAVKNIDEYSVYLLRQLAQALGELKEVGAVKFTLPTFKGTLPNLEVELTGVEERVKGMTQSFNEAITAAEGAAPAFADVRKEADRLNAELEEQGEELKKTPSLWKKLSESISNTNAKVSQFLASIKRIAMYRLIRSALKAITQGFREGIQNMYQYSLLINGKFKDSMDSLATTALYLKNSMGALIAPLINQLAPVIERIVDGFVDFTNVLAELFAIIGGQDTWSRALKYPKAYAEEMDAASGAAKELRATLLGFDEINRLDDNRRGGRGSAADLMDYSKMFEEVTTRKLSDFWDDFVSSGETKFALFAATAAGLLALKLSGALGGIFAGSGAIAIGGQFAAAFAAGFAGYRLGNWLYENDVFGIKGFADYLMENGLGKAIDTAVETAKGAWEDYLNWWDENIDLSEGWDIMLSAGKDAWNGFTSWVDKHNIFKVKVEVENSAWENFANMAINEITYMLELMGIKPPEKTTPKTYSGGRPYSTPYTEPENKTPPYYTPNADAYQTLKTTTTTAVETVKKASNAVAKNMANLIDGFNAITSNSLLFRAGGGSVETGSLFLANENGPELIGQVGNKTQVANNDQITESIKVATMAGNAEGNGLLRQAVSILNGILQKDNVVVAEVTTDSITSGLDRQNRRNGRTTVPVGV